ncbi:hypothetical protein PAMP_001453 [Pampus punctatissimus]
MSALLRSARLLKFSPSGLLRITGTNRTGASLARLYSGALGVRRTTACYPQIRPDSGNVCSRVWPYAVGCVRNYAITKEKDEASVGVLSKQAESFDRALTKLDNSVRRTGRITKTLLLRIFHATCRTGYPSGNQALLLLRSCGSLLAEVPLKERTDLAHRIWDKLEQLGTKYDVSHYNALLKAYLQNDFKFSPTDFLAKMEAANVQPNRVTYQRLIAAYCQNGHIEGASTILGFMKTRGLPITEAVFNSLITGHARAGDMEGAKNILSVMQGAGIEPGPDTYLSLLNIYAEKGDLDSLQETLKEAESAYCSLMDKDIMQIIFTLAKAEHQQHIPEMIKHLKQEMGYIPDAMNLCLSLITEGLEDTAFQILKTFPKNEDFETGNFFLKHCIAMDTSLEKIVSYCKYLQESNLHSAPFTFTLYCALELKKTEVCVELMKVFKEHDLPIRTHYFWPLLTQHVKDNNIAGMLEVVKDMRDLGVAPDIDTLYNYIFPLFPDVEAAVKALKDVGIPLESEGILTAEIRSMAVNNLAKLYARMSDPSFPQLDINNFRNSLIKGFRRFDDVELMAKITELLYKDERFSKENLKPTITASSFLYSLIENVVEEGVQVPKDKLQQYLNQLQTKNIIISRKIYRDIQNLLLFHHLPELAEDLKALEESGDQSAIPVAATPRNNRTGSIVLEKKLAELKADNKPIRSVVKHIIHSLCAEENLQHALEVKKQHEDEMTQGSYATLINLCCRHNNVEEALNLKREMSHKDSSAVLDISKYLALVRVLSKNGKVEEAVDILKEMKEKEVVLNNNHISTLFHILNTLVANGGIPAIKRLQDAIFTLGLAKPSKNLCSPLINAYLDSNDLSGAIEAALDCQKRYSQLPQIHNIIVALMEKGDTELLQKAMDIVSQERGEMSMLYDLFFAFLETGRYNEARKIIETPGLRAKPGRLQWYAEQCISKKQLETMEQMVDMTNKLFGCDRDEMYFYILRICKETNNWQKAEAVWTKMEEENVIPRERTQRLLGEILKDNVPFEVPKTWYEEDGTPQEVESAPSTTAAKDWNQYQAKVFHQCKKGKATKAYRLLKEADKNGVVLGSAIYDQVIRTLLSKGFVESAMEVKDIAVSHVPSFTLSDTANSLLMITHSKKGRTQEAFETMKSMLQADLVPMPLSVTRLVQALGSQGDMAGIQKVESLMKDLGTPLNLSKMLFINNMTLAHINRDDLESAVELLEAFYTSPDSVDNSMSYVFRRILADDNDKALDKLSAMAERLANHFGCYRPISDLFIQLLDMDKVDDAKFLLDRCNALAEQKEVLKSYMCEKAQTPGQVGKIKTLLSMIPDFAEKEMVHSYLMKCHSLDNDLLSAKALYDLMQKEGTVDELSLKRLAMLYRNAGESVPFTEPPNSFAFYIEKLKEKVAEDKMTADK